MRRLDVVTDQETPLEDLFPPADLDATVAAAVGRGDPVDSRTLMLVNLWRANNDMPLRGRDGKLP